MSILIIGPEEQILIDVAIAIAQTNPIPWEVAKAIVEPNDGDAVLLRDRKPGADEIRAKYKPQNVMLGTYRVAISFEEQPLGIFRHVSVSSHAPKMVPGPEVMQMVCEACGFSGPLCGIVSTSRTAIGRNSKLPFRVWLEEFEPGRFAVNVIEFVP